VTRLAGLGFDQIDLNMGCPVRKIVGAGWGAAFLKQPDRLSQTVAAARAATDRALSVKCRLGFDRHHINIDETSRRIAEGGADLLTIHGRTRADSYAQAVDYDRMAGAFSHCRRLRPGLVLAGNGNVLDLASALEMAGRTACDAVMISRGALGNPWVFRQLLDQDPRPPTLEEWLDGVLRHLAYHQEFHGENSLSAHRVRKHLAWYIRGFPRARETRDCLTLVESLDEAVKRLRPPLAEDPSAVHGFRHRRSLRRSDAGAGP
jgi:tRNA-dihydrouridine synthase